MTDDRDETAAIESAASEDPEVAAAQAPDPDAEQFETNGAGVAALVPAPARRASGALMPLPADQVVEGMRAYQRLLRDLLEPSDWQTRDKHGNALEKPFLKKSGWRKIARAFNLSFERVHSQVERESDGSPVGRWLQLPRDAGPRRRRHLHLGYLEWLMSPALRSGGELRRHVVDETERGLPLRVR